MTATPGVWQIQKALVTALAANAGVSSFVSTRIYDEPPANTTYPLIRIGDINCDPFSARDFTGFQCVAMVHAIDNTSRGSGISKQIADAVIAALDNNESALSPGAGTIVLCQSLGCDPPQQSNDGTIWLTTAKLKILYEFT